MVRPRIPDMRSPSATPMKSVASLEARVHAAARLLALDALATRDALVGAAPQPSPPWPDASTFAADARAITELDPAAGALLAEAWLVSATRRASVRYAKSLAAKPLAMRGEREPIALRGTVSAAMTERNAARREAVTVAADARALETRDAAREMVESLRRGADALPAELLDTVLPDEDPSAVLAATEDLWRELDARTVKAREIDPARVRWSDRLYSLVGPAVLAQVPPATWSALSVDWWARVGEEGACAGVRDAMGASSRDARGVHALVTDPGARAVLAGRAAPSAWGAAEVMGAGSVAAGSVVARGLWVAHRRGIDRVSDGALHALGRRLLHDREFLHRAAQVDRGAREAVMLDALHAELARVRWDAALGRFVRDALRRAPELGARYAEIGRAHV